MTDQYEPIRQALATDPAPGPWTQGTLGSGIQCVWTAGNKEPGWDMGPKDTWIDCNTEANAAYIAACDPDTIRDLLAERDALIAAVRALPDVCGLDLDYMCRESPECAAVREIVEGQ